MVAYDLAHLTGRDDQLVEGEIQDDEALFLYSLIRGMRLKRVLEVGGAGGYSATNFVKAVDGDGIVYTVGTDDVAQVAPNHKTILKDAATVVAEDVDYLPLDLVFFDCHLYDGQMELFFELRRSGVVTDATVLALHDTNLHPHKFVESAYLAEPCGFVHQIVERQMVNDFKEMGYDAFSLHTKLAYHGPHLPYRHGVTILSRHAAFDNRRREDAGERAAALTGPSAPQLPPPAASVAPIAAPETGRELVPVAPASLPVLAGNDRDLQRELASLQVRCWRDEEAIEALRKELDEARAARGAAARRGRALAAEVATLHARHRPALAAWRGKRSGPGMPAAARRPVLGGDGPFVERGFVLDETAATAGATVRRIKSAPSGTMIYGPYISLPAGRYAVTVDARLYERLPVVADFKVDVVCDGARRILGWRDFHLHSLARWRHFELGFTVWDDDDYGDFEIRVWARQGTPLEIGAIGVDALAEETGTALPA